MLSFVKTKKWLNHERARRIRRPNLRSICLLLPSIRKKMRKSWRDWWTRSLLIQLSSTMTNLIQKLKKSSEWKPSKRWSTTQRFSKISLTLRSSTKLNSFIEAWTRLQTLTRNCCPRILKCVKTKTQTLCLVSVKQMKICTRIWSRPSRSQMILTMKSTRCFKRLHKLLNYSEVVMLKERKRNCKKPKLQKKR